MRTGPTIKKGASEQGYATPWEFIKAVEERFAEKFVLDLAAEPETAKAPLFYTKQDNAFTKPWSKTHGLQWLNPEFANIGPWAERCYTESRQGARILMLTPASVGTNWFRDFIHKKALVLALNGRITFVGQSEPYPKDCILSCFGFPPDFDVWTWPNGAVKQTVKAMSVLDELGL